MKIPELFGEHVSQNFYAILLGLRLQSNFVVEVRPVERCLEHQAVLQAEQLLAVGRDLGCGRGGQPYDGHLGKQIPHHAKKFVVCPMEDKFSRP